MILMGNPKHIARMEVTPECLTHFFRDGAAFRVTKGGLPEGAEFESFTHDPSAERFDHFRDAPEVSAGFCGQGNPAAGAYGF